jgi:hypothetical protein
MIGWQARDLPAPNVIFLLLSIAVAYALALAWYSLVRVHPRWATPSGTAVAAALLACPLLIPAGRVGMRALAAVVCVDLFFKIVEMTTNTVRAAKVISLPEYYRFLIPFPVLLVVLEHRLRRSGRTWPLTGEIVRTLTGGLIFAAALGLTLAATHSRLLRSSFALDHVVKLILFLTAIEALSQLLLGLERLCGYDTRPIIDRAFLSSTPAEFWSRYNTRVHDWLYRNVFLLAGGRRSPVRGVILVFLVSAALHELMFGIATSRFDGYQAAFFLLQAPAVLLSRSLERLAKTGIAGSAIARGLTIVWMGTTSMLFFHGVDRVFPLVYASEPWLP